VHDSIYLYNQFHDKLDFKHMRIKEHKKINTNGKTTIEDVKTILFENYNNNWPKSNYKVTKPIKNYL
jgi:hypothetical protein